jgi:hypothetical protein
MSTSYVVNLTLDEEEFANFAKTSGIKSFSVEVVQTTEPAHASLFEPEGKLSPNTHRMGAVKKPGPPRKTRVSKVNTAIMTALANGPQTLKGLKESLEEAGLSPGSLSTGLAYLQKERLVERVDSGTYAMMAKAAE